MDPSLSCTGYNALLSVSPLPLKCRNTLILILIGLFFRCCHPIMLREKNSQDKTCTKLEELNPTMMTIFVTGGLSVYLGESFGNEESVQQGRLPLT